jgi:hypothetical protein
VVGAVVTVVAGTVVTGTVVTGTVVTGTVVTGTVVTGTVVTGTVVTGTAVAGVVGKVETVATVGTVVEVLGPDVVWPGVVVGVEVGAGGAGVVPASGATLVGGTLLRACGRPPLAGASIE